MIARTMPRPKLRERLVHRLALTANRDAGAGRQLAETVDRVLHRGGGAAEVASLTPQSTSITRCTL